MSPGRIGPSVLFISHDAQPHGAQIFLLRFLRWLRARSDLRFEVLLGGDGRLKEEFAAWGACRSGPTSAERRGPCRRQTLYCDA